MFVTELDRLLPFDPLTSVPGRAVQLNSDPQQSNNYEYSAINRNLCQRVSAVMEDLWHYCRALFSPHTSRTMMFLRITSYFTKWKGNFKLSHKLVSFSSTDASRASSPAPIGSALRPSL